MSTFGQDYPQPTPAPAERKPLWLWLALGCGCLGLLVMCALPAAGYFFWRQSRGDVLSAEVVPVPVAPTTTPPALPGGTDGRRITISITEVQNVPDVAVGASCAFEVTRHDRPDGTFWCNAQISCGNQALYGGSNAGYFDCTLYGPPQRHVVGDDRWTSAQDQDASLHLNTLNGEFELRDDAQGARGAFLLRGRVSAVE